MRNTLSSCTTLSSTVTGARSRLAKVSPAAPSSSTSTLPCALQDALSCLGVTLHMSPLSYAPHETLIHSTSTLQLPLVSSHLLIKLAHVCLVVLDFILRRQTDDHTSVNQHEQVVAAGSRPSLPRWLLTDGIAWYLRLVTSACMSHSPYLLVQQPHAPIACPTPAPHSTRMRYSCMPMPTPHRTRTASGLLGSIKSDGMRNSSSARSSSRLFCSGVPVFRQAKRQGQGQGWGQGRDELLGREGAEWRARTR